jgi:hypothetical protein
VLTQRVTSSLQNRRQLRVHFGGDQLVLVHSEPVPAQVRREVEGGRLDARSFDLEGDAVLVAEEQLPGEPLVPLDDEQIRWAVIARLHVQLVLGSVGLKLLGVELLAAELDGEVRVPLQIGRQHRRQVVRRLVGEERGRWLGINVVDSGCRAEGVGRGLRIADLEVSQRIARARDRRLLPPLGRLTDRVPAHQPADGERAPASLAALAVQQPRVVLRVGRTQLP